MEEDLESGSYKFYLKPKHTCTADKLTRVTRRKIRTDILLEIKNLTLKGLTSRQIIPLIHSSYKGHWKPNKNQISCVVNNQRNSRTAELKQKIVKIIKNYKQDGPKIKQWFDSNQTKLEARFNVKLELYLDVERERFYFRIEDTWAVELADYLESVYFGIDAELAR